MITRVALALVLAACGSEAKPTMTPSNAAVVQHAPQLFTVEQLRDGNPAGRVIELRIEIAGKPTIVQHWEFTKVDASGATIRSISKDEAGTVTADESGTQTWDELHSHGKFPAATTTIEDNVSLTVPAGTFKTRLYTIREDGATRKMWFAVDLPGPPIQFQSEKDGEMITRGVMLRAR